MVARYEGRVMQGFKCGLIVGKFSPLHNGHLLLIQRAQAACETLYILSYTNPEFQGCEPKRRAEWLSKAAPQAHICVVGHHIERPAPPNGAPNDIHRAYTAKIFANYFGLSPNAVFTSEPYGDGFADFLSHYFNQPIPHINVDQARTIVPISATEIRRNIFGHHEYVPDYVYQDFIHSVLLLGGESTGKSTMATHLAALYGEPYIEEYGRTLWEEQNGALSFDDYTKIAVTHTAYEDMARANAQRYIFVDTSPLTTLFYGLEQYGKAAPALTALADRRYDHVFLAHPDFPMVQDGTRQDETFRRRQHDWYIEQLNARRMPYTDLRGSFDDKVKIITSVLAKTG